MTFNFTRGHLRPLATLTCNFGPAIAKPRAHDADKLRVTMLSVYKSLAIISRRDIEMVTCLYESFFVQAEQCLGFTQKAYPMFLFGKSGEQLQRYPSTPR